MAVLDTRVYSSCFIADINFPLGGILGVVRVSSEGVTMFDSGAVTYQPRIILVGDTVKDDNGITRSLIRLSMRGPYTIGLVTTVFPTLAALMRVYGKPLNGQVTVRKRAWNAGGNQTVLHIKGVCVQITDIGPTGVTLHIESRADMGASVIPSRSADSDGVGGSENAKHIPAKNASEAFPIALGSPMPYIGPLYSGLEPHNIFDGLILAGMPLTASPVLDIQHNPKTTRYAWTEKLSTGLLVKAAWPAGRELYSYFPSVDAWGQVYDSLLVSYDSDTTPWLDRAYTWEIPNPPYFKIPLLCSAVNDASINLIDGEYAIDGKHDTYATLGYGNTAYFDFPVDTPHLGRLSMNASDDAASGLPGDIETEYAPIGIQVIVLLAAPPGTDVTSQTDCITLAVRWPYTSNTLFFSNTQISPPPDYGMVRGGRTVLPPIVSVGSEGTENGGWLGTKFHRFDFTNDPTGDGDDRPLYNGGNAGGTAPFRVYILNMTTLDQIPIYIVSVAIIIGFQYGVSDEYETYKINTGVDPRYRRGSNWRDPWNRGTLPRPLGQRGFPDPFIERSPDKLYSAGEGYADDGSGTYTGTASAELTSPIACAKYALKQYGSQVDFVESGFGSWSQAESDLSLWLKAANGNSTYGTWTFHKTLMHHTRVEEAKDELVKELPETTIVKVDDGSGQLEWGCHVWAPSMYAGIWNNKYYQTGGAIVPQDTILIDDDGRLALDIMTADIGSGIVNEINIKYDYDIGSGKFRRTAWCKWDGSDDGYGNEWPSVPGSGGVSSVAIANHSKSYYGAQKKKEIKLYTVNRPVEAVTIGIYTLWRYYRPVIRIRFTGTEAWYGLQPFHLFRFSDDLEDKFYFPAPLWGTTDWSSIWWRCTHVEGQVADDGAQIYKIEAEWCPISIGDDVQGGKGSELGQVGMLEEDIL